MMDVNFEPIEEENSELQHIVFNAEADGRPIECAITYQALTDHYEAEYSDPLFAFMMARSDIEKIAKKLIENNETTNNKLVITSEHVSDSLK